MLWFFGLVALGNNLVHLVEFGGHIKIELPSIMVLLVDVLCEYPHPLQNQKPKENYEENNHQRILCFCHEAEQ